MNKKIISCLALCLALTFILNISAFALNGDIDNDQVNTTEDARNALLFTAKVKTPTYEEIEKADVNRDGYVTIEDARMILRDASSIEPIVQHDFTPWIVIEEPTTTSEGYAECTCTKCNETFIKVLPKKNITINYFNKSIDFYSDKAALVAELGNPQDILTKESNINTIELYVYCKSYKDLAVFTFIDNELCEYYAVGTNTSIEAKGAHYSIKGGNISRFDGLTISPYKDEINNKIYAFSATTNKGYLANDRFDNSVGEKLNFHIVNAMRAIDNIKPLKYSMDMHETAIAHSKDMAKRGFFDHINPDGKDPFERMEIAGIHYSCAAENIAAGNPDVYYTCNRLYNSPGHRSNILNADLEYLGVGICYSDFSNYKSYTTQNFFTP